MRDYYSKPLEKANSDPMLLPLMSVRGVYDGVVIDGRSNLPCADNVGKGNYAVIMCRLIHCVLKCF